MSILEKINSPKDLKSLKISQLEELAREIRQKMIQTVSVSGGHLASSLGTVELTLALYYVFDLDNDKVIWDVGHQAYTHKIVTGRKDKFFSLRKKNGISGFPRRSESPYDFFGTGHAGTSISAALGFDLGNYLKQEKSKTIAIIGDGSLTAGIAFEGLNNAGNLAKNLLVVLNDNEIFISHKVGALADYFTRILTFGAVKKLEKRVKRFLQGISIFGIHLTNIVRRFKVLLFPGMLFEEIGFSYLGPVDGHNLYRLIEVFKGVKDLNGPVLIHVLTKKGKGYIPAEKNPTLFHSASPFEIIDGEFLKKPKKPTYTEIFSQTLIRLAEKDNRIIAITAAMPEGTGLDKFAKKFPQRFFDVGIAEQHAVTFAAGLACQGFKPVCAIYSTFLQRAFDQIIHDVCLQNLDVIFAIDRAGIVGEDGATHQGIFDLSYLRLIPNLTIISPKDENELQHAFFTALNIGGPVAIRYPKGEVIGVLLETEFKLLPLGKGEILKEGEMGTLIACGNMVYPAFEAANELKKEGIDLKLINLRFIKPINKDWIFSAVSKSPNIWTIEENVLNGGMGSAINEIFSCKKKIIYNFGLPDEFIEHGNANQIRQDYGLDSKQIFERIRRIYA